MLNYIPKVMTPEIMNLLMEMGHSDEIALVDAHFPGYSNAKRFYRASGVSIPELLDAILYFFHG